MRKPSCLFRESSLGTLGGALAGDGRCGSHAADLRQLFSGAAVDHRRDRKQSTCLRNSPDGVRSYNPSAPYWHMRHKYPPRKQTMIVLLQRCDPRRKLLIRR
jgi:hypothetical protein